MNAPRFNKCISMRLEPDIPRLTHQNGVKVVVQNGRPRVYKTPALRDLEAKYCTLLKPHAPPSPLDGPICLRVAYYFRSSAACTTWKTTKPDTDNLLKTLKDCLTHCGFWKDDAQVCSESVVKFLSGEDWHGIVVNIQQLDGTP